ncbi:MAG: RluA family pseudouridine synthase [Dehalococcoidia bacterium]|nr:RluA family pseudouridine synthase [Dehalococcoidia bacterium]
MNDRVEYLVETGGERLDVFLAEQSPDLSRSRIRKLIDDGHVTVDGRPGKASTRLAAGQTVTLGVPPPSSAELHPWEVPLSVVFEDEDLIVIDKPAGMTVHPAPGNEDHTLANAILAHAPDIEGIGGERRPGIVHRLDKDTSGLIVVAKNERAHAHLSDQFKSREVSKVYLALVVGHPSPPEADIDAPIGRHPHDRQRMAIVSTGRPAITRYRIVTSYSRSTLVEARPRTGRTHQIRVHLSSVGHPVVADTTYGRPAEGLSRQFLHAFRLGFIHPASGETVRFSAELPCDLRSHLDRLVPA